MSESYSDNLDQVLASLDAELPSRDHVLEFANVMEYARYLHAKEGYYVFNPEHALKVVRSWLKDLIASDQPLSDRNVQLALDGAGYEEINFLTSKTGTMRPPVKKGEGKRRAHPGGWADITRNLANAYRHRVDDGKVREADYPEPTEHEPELPYP